MARRRLMGGGMRGSLRWGLALSLVLGTAGCDRGDHPGQLGRIAPEFTVTDSQRTVNLNSYRGRVVVLNFWATWCAPCIQELPSLEAMQAELPGVQVIGVAVDQDAAAYQNFLATRHVTLLTVLDPNERASDLYGTHGWPETYIIDKTGRIRRKFIGPQDWTSPEIADYLRKLERTT